MVRPTEKQWLIVIALLWIAAALIALRFTPLPSP